MNILFPKLETLIPNHHMASVYALLGELLGAQQIATAHLTHLKPCWMTLLKTATEEIKL